MVNEKQNGWAVAFEQNSALDPHEVIANAACGTL